MSSSAPEFNYQASVFAEGGIYAKVVADTRHPQTGCRLTTLELRYPRIIHSEIMTHRRNSRNAASSRAIPVMQVIRDVWRDPFVPIYWGAAQSGMQASNEVPAFVRSLCRRLWLMARLPCLVVAWLMLKLGLHKQVPNRILEPWSYITVVFSGTTSSFANLFALRCHPKAEPHFQVLANAIRQAMEQNCQDVVLAKLGYWHLPYFGMPGDDEVPEHTRPHVSAARCARVSYLTQAGVRDVIKDLELYDRLVAEEPKHASALEHTAVVEEVGAGLPAHEAKRSNFEAGFTQLRKMIHNEAANNPPAGAAWG